MLFATPASDRSRATISHISTAAKTRLRATSETRNPPGTAFRHRTTHSRGGGVATSEVMMHHATTLKKRDHRIRRRSQLADLPNLPNPNPGTAVLEPTPKIHHSQKKGGVGTLRDGAVEDPRRLP